MSRLGLWRLWLREIQALLLAGAERTDWEHREGARWLLTGAAACLLVGVVIHLGWGYHTGFRPLNALATGLPPGLWAGLTVLGDERVAFALALLFSLRYPRLFWALLLAALIAALYSRGLKALFDAVRPPGVLPEGVFQLIGPGHRRASFPSGHSVTAAVFFGVLIYFARNGALRLLFGLTLLAVGLSRVAVGVHWPVDVAFGLGGGLLAAWAGVQLAARWPGPATDAGVHLALVMVGATLALSLSVDDGGYDAAALPLFALSAAALVSVFANYVVAPLVRGWRRGA